MPDSRKESLFTLTGVPWSRSKPQARLLQACQECCAGSSEEHDTTLRRREGEAGIQALLDTTVGVIPRSSESAAFGPTPKTTTINDGLDPPVQPSYPGGPSLAKPRASRRVEGHMGERRCSAPRNSSNRLVSYGIFRSYSSTTHAPRALWYFVI